MCRLVHLVLVLAPGDVLASSKEPATDGIGQDPTPHGGFRDAEETRHGGLHRRGVAGGRRFRDGEVQRHVDANRRIDRRNGRYRWLERGFRKGRRRRRIRG